MHRTGFLSSEANKKNLFCETVFSERENETIGKLSSKAHSGREQISLRKIKQSGCHNDKTYALYAYFTSNVSLQSFS